MDRSLKLRLARANAVLQLIDLRRAQTGDHALGACIEKQVLERELRDLEMAQRRFELSHADAV